MDNSKASLGCGTLILIALIVLLLGNKGSEEVLGEVRGLKLEVEKMSTEVDLLRQELHEVKQLLEQR